MLPVAHSKLKRATLRILIATLVSLGLWTRDLEAQAQRPQVSDVPQLTVIPRNRSSSTLRNLLSAWR